MFNNNNNDEFLNTPILIGAGGGGKSGGGGSALPEEAPDTARAKSTARIIDLLCQGEIYGLENGDKSIFLNNTPLQNDDDSYNFSGIQTYLRPGTPNQNYIPGFSDVESEATVDVEVLESNTAGVTRSITNTDVDALRVKIRIPQLFQRDEDDGAKGGTEVEFRIDIKPDGENWINGKPITIRDHFSSPYVESIRVPLSPYPGPWEIRVVRLTPDSTSSYIQNKTIFESYTEITDAKIAYPDKAVVGIAVDAQQFGTKIPERSYLIRGRKIRVPDIYDPVTREYSSQFWGGGFKIAYSNNPAWVWYDLATNERFGASIKQIDKMSVFECAKYNDELVDDGFGGKEPRFTFNTVIQGDDDAYTVLQRVASSFNAMMFYTSAGLTLVQDRPKSATRFFSPAAVVNGEFTYSSVDTKAIHTVANITYNDPANNYKQTIERVDDPQGVKRYGVNVKDKVAYGCTSDLPPAFNPTAP